MGRLSGFSYQEVTRKLRKLGFEFYRSGKGDHEIWFNPDTKKNNGSSSQRNQGGYFRQYFEARTS